MGNSSNDIAFRAERFTIKRQTNAKAWRGICFRFCESGLTATTVLYCGILVNRGRDMSDEIAFGGVAKKRMTRGRLRIIILTGIVLGIGLAAFLTANAIRQIQFGQSMSDAQTAITGGRLDLASEILNAAREDYPESKYEIAKLIVKVHHLEVAQEALMRAPILAESGNFSDACVLLGQVTPDTGEKYRKAQRLLEDFRNRGRAIAITEAGAAAKSGKFAEASKILSNASNDFGFNDEIAELYATYQSQGEAQKLAVRKAALSKLLKVTDTFSGSVTYMDKTSPRTRLSDAFYLYFDYDPEGSPTLNLVIQYFASKWLFVDSVRFNVDGQILYLATSSWERDNDHRIWEWIDEPLSDRELIEAIISSKSARIQFEGDQYSDVRTITQGQKDALKRVLRAFDTFD